MVKLCDLPREESPREGLNPSKVFGIFCIVDDFQPGNGVNKCFDASTIKLVYMLMNANWSVYDLLREVFAHGVSQLKWDLDVHQAAWQ